LFEGVKHQFFKQLTIIFSVFSTKAVLVNIIPEQNAKLTALLLTMLG